MTPKDYQPLTQGQYILHLMERARALIATPATWTQHTVARDSKDDPVDVDDPSACKFCSVGAILKVAGQGKNSSTVIAAIRGQIERSNPMSYALSVFNDQSSYDEVMLAWDRAIEQQRKGIQS